MATLYTPQTFTIPSLNGISEQNVNEHLKLYEGYVANTNAIITQMLEEPGADSYSKKEARRRLGFEFNGMRNHEYFFQQWEGGPVPLDEQNSFAQAATATFGSVAAWKKDFIETAKTRGIGWAITYYDKVADTLITTWVDEQHLGQLPGLTFIIGIDMWEHAFVYDYATSEKGAYIDAWFANLNWKTIENRFSL